MHRMCDFFVPRDRRKPDTRGTRIASSTSTTYQYPYRNLICARGTRIASIASESETILSDVIYRTWYTDCVRSSLFRQSNGSGRVICARGTRIASERELLKAARCKQNTLRTWYTDCIMQIPSIWNTRLRFNLRTWYTDCIARPLLTHAAHQRSLICARGTRIASCLLILAQCQAAKRLICARGTRIASANMHKFFYIFAEGFI